MNRTVRNLKYGSSVIPVDTHTDTDILEIENPANTLDQNIFITNLESMLPHHKKGRLSVIVSDKTRLCGYGKFLPWIIEAAEKKGFNRKDISFLIAYGTHPMQTGNESMNAYGEIFNDYHFIHHDCDDSESMITLGTTRAGTSVTVRKEVVDSEAVILFGAISHHYFAGYGGGRKLIFPGLASRDSIYNNHKLFIDFEAKMLHPGCQSGILKGNPVASDLEEIDSFFPDKIIISGILNKSGEVTRLIIGRSYNDFVEACNTYDSFYRKKGGKLYDLVIASAGGYPKDINFIQAHKSIHNAASFVRDGGTLILLGECRDGLGNEQFINIFDNGREEAVKALGKHYSGNGGTALSTMAKTERIRIFMLTSLSDSICRKMGITPVRPEDIDTIYRSVTGEKAIIENASIIYR